MSGQHFYAHTLEGDPNPDHWQALELHLSSVAFKAAEFASAFQSSEWGYLAGLWHDLGKYQDAFQRKLNQERVSVEHSGAGAAFACSKHPQNALPLAFAIAGHHAGLANLASSEARQPADLRSRLVQNKGVLDEILQHMPAAIRKPGIPRFPAFLQCESSRSTQELTRSIEFWTRFVFSALIDADRCNTQEFCSGGLSEIRGGFASIPELRNRILMYIDDKVTRLRRELKQSAVNLARALILDSCIRTAPEPTGCYSLTVPTGGGKTLASMAFALAHAEHHDLRRVIVVIPYTSIIEQNAQAYREALGVENVVEHHSTFDDAKLKKIVGEEISARQALATENWDATVIVTTTVQFFESLFSSRTSRCRKLHNIARSVIILDEVQTLPAEFLLSILDALRELTSHYGCTVVLSTATPPALLKRSGLRDGLSKVKPIIADPIALARKLKRVEYEWPDLTEPPVEWSVLANRLVSHSQVLIVVHKRQDARDLAALLLEKVESESVFHLSALMCPAHRSVVLAKIRLVLEHGRPCRTVSTQLVEAGVDVDFPIVYRALAGLDSIVQAGGRCNREGKLERGRVVVFRAASSPPRGTPRKAMDITEGMLREANGALDASNPDVFEKYFRMLYLSSDPDAHQIQTHREQFNFATVGQKFQLIEDGFTETIIVPYGDAEIRVAQLRGELERPEGPSRATRRSLQPFSVQVYSDAFSKLQLAGALEEVVDGIHVLSPSLYTHLYDERFGLVVGDELAANPAGLIL